MPALPQKPVITTKLPGPKAAKLLKLDDTYISPSYTRSYPLVMEYGEGMMVRDVDGNIFLDFAAGIAVNATGHRHPDVVAAIKDGLDNAFIHMSGTDFYYPSQIRYAEALAKAAGGAKAKVFFCNSGAEAIEGSLKLARWATGRTNFVSMTGAFHGRTFGALSVGNSKAVHRQRFHPLLPGVHHMPFPDSYRGLQKGETPEQLAERCLNHLRNIIFKKEVEPASVAAIIVEPVQGEGGYIVPPRNFLPGLRAICDQHGILLICDEVQSGMGRTGKLFAHMHFGVKPDIIATAKGIASGMPLGAIIASDKIMAWPPGTHASTFGGNPLCCRAAHATLKLLQDGLIDNAAHQGKYLLNGLKRICAKHKHVGDVRGIGLMIAADFVSNKATREADGARRDKAVDEAFKRGLLVLGCGASSIRFCPSLIVTKQHCDTALDIFADALKAVR